MNELTGLLPILAIAILAPRSGVDAAGPEAPPPSGYYVVFLRTGPAFDMDVPTRDQPGFAGHVDYVTALHGEGVLPLGGPLFADDARTRLSGALYLVRARTEEEACAIASRDPLVQEGTAEISSVQAFLAALASPLETAP